ncbi:hypothetical protein DL766_001734 [Monosporascus sp. MC13-8B]|nr:hypothetical protein DL763_005090 [Monosporascus cannonballus]RYP36977.1 hypothetical protein DL766_001734 [Monosporascus sp. MC13-8B]
MREPIALVGSACRFPGRANSPAKLWELLKNPGDLLKTIPRERFAFMSFHHEDGSRAGATDVPGVAYCMDEDPKNFDAGFFNIAPTEAEGIDPQQRLLLEVTYEALEAAGYGLSHIRGSSTAVYVGVSSLDYRDIQNRDPDTLGHWHSTGTALSIISNRLSYFFDLHGPSMTIDAACSSSMVALHLAVQALRNGDCDKAIVAGTNLILDPVHYISGSKLHLFSPTGQSRMWDQSGNGYGRGEGVAALILKPLSKAISNGDHIECIIRETGINQDGRTPGITMPSSESQLALIRQVYAQAGLDPTVDTPQFVEAHGTGTAAGDPVEARAIHEAFFPSSMRDDRRRKLLVGSIKTVIGHLEGAAGIAGVLKASLALRNRQVPPNLLFQEANPAVAPFLDSLEIPLKVQNWPEVPNGQTARASVNCFGFGGTNGHAILEAAPIDAGKPVPGTEEGSGTAQETFVGPLVLSAQSSSSLLSYIESLAAHIRSKPSLNLDDLMWTLAVRRSMLAVKSAFAAPSRGELLSKLDKAVKDGRDGADVGTRTAARNGDAPPAVLGVFTGQGAQWAAMGHTLYAASFTFRESISRCDTALGSLPDPPQWSLTDEMLKDEASSRIEEAAISQPLCTALQIALVNVLRSAGVKLDAVVGHSSGEIAACYATGVLSEHDAMSIAYYRGLYSSLARGYEGQRGSMMAVAMSRQAAEAFCSQPEFNGRIQVAASNSPSSVTVSGDADAIAEARSILTAAGTFARSLRVDTAYHSRHMLPCAEPYLNALQALDIQLGKPDPNVLWVSSVRPDAQTAAHPNWLDQLRGQYWVDNMVQPVMFSTALENCIRRLGRAPELAVEIGPHPALAGPVKDAMVSAAGNAPLYTGLLQRRAHDVEALSAAMGYLWQYLPDSYVDLERYIRSFNPPGAVTFSVVKDLPNYAWNHKPFWRESRLSRTYRMRSEKPHVLLGSRVPGDSKYEMRWRNILRLNDLPWLKSHQFQGQVMLPFAAQATMILDACAAACPEQPLATIDMHDMTTARGVVIEDGGPGTEVVSTLRITDRFIDQGETSRIEAVYSCYVCYDQVMGTLEPVCSARVAVWYGPVAPRTLPSRPSPPADTTPVPTQKVYSLFSALGLDYSGSFRAFRSIDRTSGFATASASWSGDELRGFLCHPAILDVSFQLLLSAFSSPDSGDVLGPYLPSRIFRLSLQPQLALLSRQKNVTLGIDAFLTGDASGSLEGDISVYDASGACLAQVEGLELIPFSKQDASNDRRPFTKEVWKQDIFGLALPAATPKHADNEHDKDLAQAIERSALHFLSRTVHSIKMEDLDESRPHYRLFLETISHAVNRVRSGIVCTARAEWLDDSDGTIRDLIERFPGQADLETVNLMGQSLPAILRGTVDPSQLLLDERLLERLHHDGRASPALHKAIAFFSEHLVHKYPHADILEIGAGMGLNTSAILTAIGDAYRSYTYTDVSSSCLKPGRARFQGAAQKMDFRILDIQNAVEPQGFQRHKYAFVISSVPHARRDLKTTLRNIRSLLRPGGYLLLVEATGETMASMLTFGTLSPWWLAAGRRKPRFGVSVSDWDALLCSAGFSGIDQVAHDSPDRTAHSYSVIVSRATSNTIDMLNDPLPCMSDIVGPKTRLLLVGGLSSSVWKLTRSVKKLLSTACRDITVVDSVDKVAGLPLDDYTDCICLADLDQPVLGGSRSPTTLRGLQTLFGAANNLLWYTTGRLRDRPEANMSVGIGRALRGELPWLNCQFIDVFSVEGLSSTSVVETFCRLVFSQKLEGSSEGLLWTLEPELVIDGTRNFVPRVIKNDAINDRFNAARRPVIRRSINGETQLRVASEDATRPRLCEDYSVAPTRVPSNDAVSVAVRYSISLQSAKAIGLSICLGSRTSNVADVVVAIADHPSSRIIASPYRVLHLKGTEPDALELLRLMSAFILSRLLAQHVPSRGRVLLYGADETLARAIRSSPQWQSKHILFVSAAAEGVQRPNGCIAINPQATRRVVLQNIPGGINFAVNCSSSKTDPLWQKITAALQCPDRDISSLDPGSWASDSWGEMLVESYETARKLLDGETRPSPSPVPVVPIQDIDSRQCITFPVVLDWTQPGPVTYRAAALQPEQLFSDTKSYLLVGMTGTLGLSLTTWMVRSGARHLILASRKPSVPREWLDEMASLGARIKVMALDVTDKTALLRGYEEMRAQMPVISGVCNASMVLSDGLFADMNFESFDRTLRPKVDGSRNLDEVFSSADLDFFVLFGSIGSIIGTTGQSNYHAANLFMASLVENRRRRGVAASIMDIGIVTDVGVVARSGEQLLAKLQRECVEPVSERVLHYMFGEAILASPVDAGVEPHIIIGPIVTPRSIEPRKRPVWFSNPRFSHCLVDDVGDASDREKGTSLSERLNLAPSEAAMLDIVMEAFAATVENLLELEPGTMKANAAVSMLDMGVDSGLAVQISAWFSKELAVSMPVMKVLSTADPRQLCLEALRKLKEGSMPAIVAEPQLQSASGDKAKEGGVMSPSPAADMAEEPLCGYTDPEDDAASGSSAEQSSQFAASSSDSLPTSQLWSSRKLSGKETMHNITLLFDVTGPISPHRIKIALSALVNQQEALRSSFAQMGSGELRQDVWEEKDVSTCFHHIAGADSDRVEEEYKNLAAHVWRLEEGDTFTLVLVTGPDNKHAIILAAHHIIMDGLSIALFFQGLAQAYEGQQLAPPEATYTDFASEQLVAMETGAFEKDLDFWRAELSLMPTPMPLFPIATAPTRNPMYGSATGVTTASIWLDRAHADRIKMSAQRLGCTPFRFFAAALQFLCARMAAIEDVCIGIMNTGRHDARSSGVVGHFANMVPLRSGVRPDERFSAFVHAVSAKVAATFEHSRVPFDVVVDRLQSKRNSAHMPTCLVALNYIVGNAEPTLADSQVTWRRGTMARTLMDLSFWVYNPADGSYRLEVDGRDDFYQPDGVRLILDTYAALLDMLCATPDTALKEISLFPKAVVRAAEEVGRGPAVDFGWPRSLVHRFDGMAPKHADDVAVVDEGGAMTYAQLAERVHAVSSVLQEKGVEAGCRVAVICGPSRDTLAGMLAILRLQCVYVPLDLSLPRARHAAMVNDCKPRVLLYQASTSERAEALRGSAQGMELLDINKAAAGSQLTGAPAPNLSDPDAAAVILYTSGSTSVPKGVLLTQAGCMNYIADKATHLKLDREVVLQQSSVSFDMGLAQMLHSFSHGGTLVMVPQHARGDPIAISELMQASSVTFTIATPSEYTAWLSAAHETIDQYTAWRHACLGGEFVTERLKLAFRQLRHQRPLLNNSYGPTETSCATTLCVVPPEGGGDAGQAGHVGKPIASSQIYILDANGNVVPLGYPGEICIGGRGLALGYLNQPLTEGRFVSNNFSSPSKAGVHAPAPLKICKTGDRGKLLPDGSVILMGRMEDDTQVKLRGLRIDTTEVEHALVTALPDFLSDATVTMRGEGDEAFLIAHVVLARGKSATEAELELLSRILQLPSYMLPKTIIPVHKLAMTTTGKVDRRAMADLPLPRQSNKDRPSAVRLAEGELSLVWRRVLTPDGDVLELETDSDFFLVGGNSMLLIKLQGAIKTAMGLSVPLVDLYCASTLGGMTEKITAMKYAGAPAGPVDWDVETKIPDDILRAMDDDDDDEAHTAAFSQQQRRNGKEIILTGAAGYLGREILLASLDDDAVRRVHCIAVPEELRPKIPVHPKVTIYTGSLQDPALVLTDAEAQLLQRRVDTIVLAGAHGHCLNNYHTLRAANLLSTHAAARLAIPRAVPVHYISSNRVILYTGRAAVPPVSLADYHPPSDGTNGYTASKWANGRFLEALARHRGRRRWGAPSVVVHRPCALVGESAPPEDAMNGLIRTAARIRAVPHTPNVEGYVDFHDVRVVARDIARQVVPAAEEQKPQPCRFVHHSSGCKVPAGRLASHMEALHGGTFREIHMADWLVEAGKAGLDPLAAVDLEAMMDQEVTGVYPYMGEELYS